MTAWLAWYVLKEEHKKRMKIRDEMGHEKYDDMMFDMCSFSPKWFLVGLLAPFVVVLILIFWP